MTASSPVLLLINSHFTQVYTLLKARPIRNKVQARRVPNAVPWTPSSRRVLDVASWCTAAESASGPIGRLATSSVALPKPTERRSNGTKIRWVLVRQLNPRRAAQRRGAVFAWKP